MQRQDGAHRQLLQSRQAFSSLELPATMYIKYSESLFLLKSR